MSEIQHNVRQPRAADLGRFVMSVDGQRKRGFPDKASAEAEAAALRAAFPNLTVVISDGDEEIIRERAG